MLIKIKFKMLLFLVFLAGLAFILSSCSQTKEITKTEDKSKNFSTLTLSNLNADDNSLVTAGLVADLHFSLNLNNSLGTDTSERIEKFTKECTYRKCDLVVALGDSVVDSPLLDKSTLKTDMVSIQKLLTDNLSYDSYAIFGNHDGGCIINYTNMLTIWDKLMPNNYYYMDYSNVRFIFLDVQYVNDSRHYDSDYYNELKAVLDSPHSGHLPLIEQEWLNEVLVNASINKMYSVIFVHQNSGDFPNSKVLRKIMDSNNDTLIATFHGHGHGNFHRSLNGYQYIGLPGGTRKNPQSSFLKIYETYFEVDGIGDSADYNFTIQQEAVNNFLNRS